MSSVGGSDSAERAADKQALRRQREEFRNRESELVKKHNVETRRVAEKNSDEIASLKDKHSEQMDVAREASHDAISERDHQYQREINDIRNMHKKQLQTSADETSKREKTFRKAMTTDQTKRAKHDDERYARMKDDFRTKSQAEADNFSEQNREIKDTADRSVNVMRDKLNARHEEEMDSLRDTLQEKIAKGQGDFSDYRREVGQQRREAQSHSLQANKDNSNKLMSAVQDVRLDAVQNERHLREDYKQSIEDQQERYDKALKKNNEESRNASAAFQTASEDRGVNKINSLRRENKELREQNSRDVRNLKHQAGKELAHAKESAQKNVDAYREERDEAYAEANETVRKDVGEVRERYERQLRDTSADSQSKADDQSRTYRREYDNIKGEYEGRLTQQGQLAEARIDHITSNATDEKQRLTQLNEDNHAAAQRAKQDEMKALRTTLEGDKRDSVDTLREMMRKQEIHHADRMGQVVAKYDKQVQALKDELQRERRLSTENTKRTNDEMNRAHQLDLDQAEAKSRAKLNEVNARHENEVRAVSKRYEEKLDQVLSEMKKS